MKTPQIEHGWVGVDIGKGHHWVCLIDDDGTSIWSRKVVNDEQAILEAIDHVAGLAEQSVWAVDVTGTMSGYCWRCLPHKGTASDTHPGES